MENSSYITISTNKSEINPQFSKPTVNGYFEAFGSIMFAFGGASTFPTIQVRFFPEILAIFFSSYQAIIVS